MDKDRIAGSMKQIKGSIKEAVGKGVGDTKLQSEGKADQAEGKVQNAVGGIKELTPRRNREIGPIADLTNTSAHWQKRTLQG